MSSGVYEMIGNALDEALSREFPGILSKIVDKYRGNASVGRTSLELMGAEQQLRMMERALVETVLPHLYEQYENVFSIIFSFFY